MADFWFKPPKKFEPKIQKNPGESQNRVFCCFLQRGVSATRGFVLDQKILFLAEVIEFLNLINTNNYLNLKRDFPKMDIFLI